MITSASGTHDIQVGEPLPDALTGLLTATPYSYNITAPASLTPVGDKFNEAGVRREAYNFYFQDAWKATPQAHRQLRIALRSEQPHSRGDQAHVSSDIYRCRRQADRVIGIGRRKQTMLINPQPPYDQDWNGWGPRLALDYAVGKHTVLHAGGAITTLIPNLWQDNFLTAAIPFVFAPSIYAQPGEPVAVSEHVRSAESADSL